MGRKKIQPALVFALVLSMCLGLLLTGCGGSTASTLLEDCVIVYDSEDYMSRRYASRLWQTISTYAKVTLEAEDRADASENVMKISVTESDDLGPKQVKVTVEGNTVNCRIGSYYGLEAFLDYIQETYKEGKTLDFQKGFEWTGDAEEGFTDHEDAAIYSDDRQGDHRVMTYNVLFDTSSEAGTDKPGERNVLQAEMIKQYMPDVLGLQERNSDKTTSAGEQNINLLLEELGYKELEVDLDTAIDPGNAAYENYTPIFYRQEVVTPIDGGYHNFEYDTSLTARDQSKGFTWGLFENKKSSERYIMVSTHTTFATMFAGELQAREVDAVVAELLEKHDVPVIVGGDLNSALKTSITDRFAKLGYTDIKALAKVYSSSVKAHHNTPYYWTNVDNWKLNIMMTVGKTETDSSQSIDHIMVKNNDNLTVQVYGVVVDDCTTSAADHFPIFMDFSLK